MPGYVQPYFPDSLESLILGGIRLRQGYGGQGDTDFTDNWERGREWWIGDWLGVLNVKG